MSFLIDADGKLTLKSKKELKKKVKKSSYRKDESKEIQFFISMTLLSFVAVLLVLELMTDAHLFVTLMVSFFLSVFAGGVGTFLCTWSRLFDGVDKNKVKLYLKPISENRKMELHGLYQLAENEDYYGVLSLFDQLELEIQRVKRELTNYEAGSIISLMNNMVEKEAGKRKKDAALDFYERFDGRTESV